MRERKNVYDLPAGDTTLEWYGKAVREMKGRPTTDPTSWWFQAAIHGNDPSSRYWANTKPYPSASDQKRFWEQCQHGSWYFLPWHRMYLAYFEQIVAQAVVDLGGPAGWSLPFWDYTDYKADPQNLMIPQPFTTPNDVSNSLWMPNRYNGPLDKQDLNLDALNQKIFTGNTSDPKFGGPVTSFSRSGQPHGELEYIPHDMVHMMIGGAMGSSYTAALDPIFWLHHSNIDRLWQIWLNRGDGRENPTQGAWKNFTFEFHDKNNQVTQFDPIQVVDTTQVLDGYVYQGVSPKIPSVEAHVAEMALTAANEMPLEVVAANNSTHVLGSNLSKTALGLQPPRRKRMNFMAAAAPESTEGPKTTYLHFENVKGKGLAPIYKVYLNRDENAENKDANYAGPLVLFGLEEASTPTTHHAGSGLHVVLNISDLLNRLRAQPNWSDDQLDVQLEPKSDMPEGASVEIGRISLYSE